MDTNVLVGLLRLDLECRGFVETTIREYTRLVREILNGGHSARETVELLAGLAESENL